MAKTILGTRNTKLGKMIVIECNRCAGTGNWNANQGFRVCYKCGGRGEYMEDTKESAYNRKQAHIDEVIRIIADSETRLASAKFGRSQTEKQIAIRKAQLVELRAELAKMV
jgi:uncharacterized Zn finger protein (UPF0148 family)